jgi:hypothetical protein
MHDAIGFGLWKWAVEHIAIPLLGGLWMALAWWIKLVTDKFSTLETKQSSDTDSLHARITEMGRENASTYARRDDVREGFARIDGKLDVLLKHALRDSQG